MTTEFDLNDLSSLTPDVLAADRAARNGDSYARATMADGSRRQVVVNDGSVYLAADHLTRGQQLTVAGVQTIEFTFCAPDAEFDAATTARINAKTDAALQTVRAAGFTVIERGR